MSRARRFARFLVVGTGGFAIDAALTLLLSRGSGLDPLIARIPAFLAASAFTYSVNRRWTFAARAPAWLRGWIHYVTVTGVGAVLNYVTYALVLVLLGTSSLPTLVGVALGSIVGLGFNFTLSDRVVFQRQDVR